MFGTIINSWALFSGFGLIMLAHALQGTLLNINAVFFNFSDFEIGYVFTGYFVGYLFSSIQRIESQGATATNRIPLIPRNARQY